MSELRRRLMMQKVSGVEILRSVKSFAPSYFVVHNIYADSESELYVKFSVENGDGGYSIVGVMNNTVNQQIGGGGWATHIDMRFGVSSAGHIPYKAGQNIEVWVNKTKKTQIIDSLQTITYWNGDFQGEVCDFLVGLPNDSQRGLVGRFYEISLKRNGEYTMRLLPAKKNNKYGFYDMVSGVFYESERTPYAE